MHAYMSLTIPLQAFLLVDRVGAIACMYLLNRIDIIQTRSSCRKVGRAWYTATKDHNQKLLSTVKWFISSYQSMI